MAGLFVIASSQVQCSGDRPSEESVPSQGRQPPPSGARGWPGCSSARGKGAPVAIQTLGSSGLEPGPFVGTALGLLPLYASPREHDKVSLSLFPCAFV